VRQLQNFVFYLAFTAIIPFSALGQFQSEIVPLTSTEDVKAEKEKEKGVKIGDKLYLWASTSTYNYKDDFFLNQLKGTSYAGTAGLDYKVTPDTKLGFYYLQRLTNSHTPINTSSFRTEGNNFYPYFIYNFTPKFYFYLVAGYINSTTKIKYFYQRFLSQPPNPVFAKSKGALWSIYPSFNVAFVPCDNVEGSFQLGYGNEYFSSKSYRDSLNFVHRGLKTNRSYGFTFLDLSYFFTNVGSIVNSIAPFVQGGGNYYLYNTPVRSSGRNYKRAREGYTVGTGLRFYCVNNVTFTAGWQRIAGHSGYSANVYTLLVRVGGYEGGRFPSAGHRLLP